MSPGRRLGLHLAVPLLLLLASCAPNAPQDTLRPAGPIARTIMDLFWPVFWIAVAIFILVEGGILFAVIRFRERRGTPMPKQVHGNVRLEIAWTVVPALLLTGVAIATVSTIIALAREPKGALEVTVTAHQWWWEYQYPEQGVVTANELHIPTGRPVLLTLESKDVIHAFWAPKLGGKQDVIPGRVNKLTIEADAPGTYLGQCVEFCGLSHANMRLRVVAQTPEDFARWVEEQKQPAAPAPSGPPATGEDLFVNGACAGCHTVAGTTAQGRVGPNLTHLASRQTFAGAIFDLNRQNLMDWLRDPPAMKPMQPEQGIGMPNLNLTEDEIEALVAYLETLR